MHLLTARDYRLKYTSQMRICDEEKELGTDVFIPRGDRLQSRPEQ